MVNRLACVLMLAAFSALHGCAFVQEATRYHSSDYQPSQQTQQEWQNNRQERIDRVNTYNQIYNSFQQQAPRQPTQTNCQADGFGGMNCQHY